MKTIIALLIALTASLAYAKASEEAATVKAKPAAQKTADLKSLMKKALSKLIPSDDVQIYKPQPEDGSSGLMMDLVKGPEYRESRRLSELSKEEIARMHFKIVFGEGAKPKADDGGGSGLREQQMDLPSVDGGG